jgi:hypothetical protein
VYYLASPFYLAIFLYMHCGRKKGVIRVADKSAIQRIKELDAERASIFEQAKEEALEKAKAAVAELNALGLNYTLTNGPEGKARPHPLKRNVPSRLPLARFVSFRPPRRTTAGPTETKRRKAHFRRLS